MSKVIVSLAGKSVILDFMDFDDEVNVDDLTSIHYENLYGEAVTVSALLNKVGILRAEAESISSSKKLECDIYEAKLSRQYRREANVNSGKFSMPDDNGGFSYVKLTEDSLKSAILLDLAYQNKKKSMIEAQKNFAFIESIYWAIQSKDRKLSVLMKSVTPEEFYDEIVEGKVNSIVIKKPTDTWVKK